MIKDKNGYKEIHFTKKQMEIFNLNNDVNLIFKDRGSGTSTGIFYKVLDLLCKKDNNILIVGRTIQATDIILHKFKDHDIGFKINLRNRTITNEISNSTIMFTIHPSIYRGHGGPKNTHIFMLDMSILEFLVQGSFMQTCVRNNVSVFCEIEKHIELSIVDMTIDDNPFIKEKKPANSRFFYVLTIRLAAG